MAEEAYWVSIRTPDAGTNRLTYPAAPDQAARISKCPMSLGGPPLIPVVTI